MNEMKAGNIPGLDGCLVFKKCSVGNKTDKCVLVWYHEMSGVCY